MNAMPLSWALSIVLIFLLVAYALLVWQRAWIHRGIEFLTDVKAELKKVTWPGKREVQGTTLVVLVTVFFFGVYLSVIDFAVAAARNYLFELVRG